MRHDLKCRSFHDQRIAHDRRILVSPEHDRRWRPHGRDCNAAWACRDPRVHARRHPGRHEGRDMARCARERRRHRAGQHLSFDAAAGRGTHRRARRTARVYPMGRADPDGLGRLPGHVARESTQGRRGWRDLPFPCRRRDDRALARTCDRDSKPARFRHCDAARRMHRLASHGSRHRTRDAAFAALGRTMQARIRSWARTRAVRNRAGRRHREPA